MESKTRYGALAAAIAVLASGAYSQQVNVPPDDDSAAHGSHAVNAGRLRASKLIGARIQNAEGEDLGEVEDLLLSADVEVVAAILSVGGFLDIGDKLVAIPYGELRMSTGGDLYLPMTKDQLAAKPEFKDTESIVMAAAEPHTVPPAREPEPETVQESNTEAQAQSFAGEDPRVAEGIAENKEAYEDDEAEAP